MSRGQYVCVSLLRHLSYQTGWLTANSLPTVVKLMPDKSLPLRYVFPTRPTAAFLRSGTGPSASGSPAILGAQHCEKMVLTGLEKDKCALCGKERPEAALLDLSGEGALAAASVEE